MQPSSNTVSYSSLSDPIGQSSISRRSEDFVYQGFTVVAILLVLGSLWAF
jgi:hypothetical protein